MAAVGRMRVTADLRVLVNVTSADFMEALNVAGPSRRCRFSVSSTGHVQK